MIDDPKRAHVERLADSLAQTVGADPDSAEGVRGVADLCLALHRLGRDEEALERAEATSRRHAASASPDLRGAARHVLASKAKILRDLGRAEAAALAQAEVDRLPHEGVPSPLADGELEAVRIRAEQLLEAGELSAAIDVLEPVLNTYALDAPPASQQLELVRAAQTLVLLCARAGDLRAVVETLSEIVRRFAHSGVAEVRHEVAHAWSNWAFYVRHGGDLTRADELDAEAAAYAAETEAASSS